MAELLDGCVTKNWFASNRCDERWEDGRARILAQGEGPVLPEAKFVGRPWFLDFELPLPTLEMLDKIDAETRAFGRERHQ